jgi:TRAP-type C4-dicarboxylate transport system substrate-binding protein
MMKNHLLGLLALITTALISLPTQAEITLRFAHFFPAVAGPHRNIFVPWAQSIEQASKGEIKIQFFPGQIMLRSDALYQGTVHGVADISVTVLGYNASTSALIDQDTANLGRFPISQIGELPGLSSRAQQASCIVQSLYDEGLTANDFADTHVLYLFATGPAYLHTRSKTVTTPKDLKGLRIRQPSPVARQILVELGTQPVGLPAPALASALERGQVDGALMPWDGMKTFGANPMTNSHTEVPLYSTSFVVSMNKLTYKRLPPHLKAIIDQHSGMTWTQKAADVFAGIDEASRGEAKGEIIEIPDPMNDPNWRGPLTSMIDNYIQSVSSIDPNARQVYQRALALKESCK